MERIENYVAGRFVKPVSGEYLDNIDPAIGRAYSKVPASDDRAVEQAVAAAKNAFPAWSRTPASKRSALLLEIADLIDKNRDRLAMAECVDNGKPLTLAKTLDIPRAAMNFRFFGSAVLHLQSECHVTDEVAVNYTLRKPRGVAGIISPWNLPLYLFSWKVAPAIATGNTVVAKPSEVTPMTAFLLAQLCDQAGLPAGVLNVVHGTGPKAGAAIVRHADVPPISFTGGTATGAEIARRGAPLF